MEAAGAVCLPAAGTRSGSDVVGIGIGGIYWSSSADAGDEEKACIVYFDSSDFRSDTSYLRFLGSSVRLITESE